MGTQTIKGDTNLIASNIRNGVSIFGVTGTYASSGGSGSDASINDVMQNDGYTIRPDEDQTEYERRIIQEVMDMLTSYADSMGYSYQKEYAVYVNESDQTVRFVFI